MALLFGAAGAFKEVIEVTGAGKFIALWASQLPFSPIIVCYVVAMLIRIALGSATASILTASGILAALADQYPEMRTQLILAIAIGVTFMTQPADSGFWLVKEYCNMSVRDIFLKFNPCRMFMSIIGLLLLLAWQSLRGSASG
jgi:Gnt-I system high-affinity gluconate transporter